MTNVSPNTVHKNGLWTPTQIVTGIIVAGELLHRAHEQEWYERWMEHKRWLEEQDPQRQLELQRR